MSKSRASSRMETPPLTRGRLGLEDDHAARPGNTPAYAGKTGAHHGNNGPKEKHPRLRGEDMKSDMAMIPCPETPPLTRGRRPEYLGGSSSRGNTPAYAGKTWTPIERGAYRRNTPAYAGKTRHAAIGKRERQKHPRLRGEDHCRGGNPPARPETPPLTRGRLSGTAKDPEALRNTPAYAGKT